MRNVFAFWPLPPAPSPASREGGAKGLPVQMRVFHHEAIGLLPLPCSAGEGAGGRGRIVGRGLLILPLLLLLLAGCTSSPTAETPPALPAAPTANADRSAGAFADTDSWVLKTTDPNAVRGNHGIFLGNG